MRRSTSKTDLHNLIDLEWFSSEQNNKAFNGQLDLL